jgi:hypothetical protein
MLHTMLSIVLNFRPCTRSLVDGFGGDNIACEIMAEILNSVLELPGQVVNALHNVVHMIALHLFILYQHYFRTRS